MTFLLLELLHPHVSSLREAGGEGQKAPLSVSVLRRRSFSQETIYLLITPRPLLLGTALYYRRRGGGGGEVLISYFFRFSDRETQLLIG